MLRRTPESCAAGRHARMIFGKRAPEDACGPGRDMPMTIAAILKHKGGHISAVAPSTTIAELVHELAEKRIGAVLVLDAAEQILGIVSERDIVARLAANGAATLDMTASQLMTRAVKTASPRTTVAEAMSIMTDGRFRHLPVVEGGVLLGIISIGDVVKARIMQQEHEVDSLKAYVAGVG
jgi:CBS domain-containing protein